MLARSARVGGGDIEIEEVRLSLGVRLEAVGGWFNRYVITEDFDRLARGCLSIFGVVVSGLAFYFSFEQEFDYAVKLVIWFVFWLSVFHAYYAFKRALTMRSARQIDYWYLGIAGIGVVFFAISYSEQRVDYLGQFERGRVETNAEDAASKVKYVVGQYLSIACDLADTQATTEEDCDRAQELFRASRKPLTTEALAGLRSDFSKVYEAEKKKKPEHEKQGDGYRRYQLSYAMERVQQATEYAIETIKRNESMPAWQPPPRRERDTFKVLLGLGQVVLWPFILALALALRITKVTIEVQRWAKDEVKATIPPAP
jgi:hypothetical protein